jgi:hypothetical protein
MSLPLPESTGFGDLLPMGAFHRREFRSLQNVGTSTLIARELPQGLAQDQVFGQNYQAAARPPANFICLTG